MLNGCFNDVGVKRILILDFDLTITDVHTYGMINHNILYWNSQDNFNLLVSIIQKFKKSNLWLIYIVSRGIESDIKEYLTKLNIINLFDDIYGAKDQEHLSKSTKTWSLIKSSYINMIKNKNNSDNQYIYYIDDTKENILESKKNGYSNSILLPNIGTSSIMLTSILDKIYNDNIY